MIIEKMYDKFYAESEKAAIDDQAISAQITAILEGTGIDKLNEEKLGQLLCSASLIGQRTGFTRGFRFAIQVIAESVL